jgi:hypothetical protein
MEHITMIDAIGYLALVINLYSMSSNSEYRLRYISSIANFIYVIYGILIGAIPIIIGGSIAVFLHIFHLKKLKHKI